MDKYLAGIEQMERLIRIRSNLKSLRRHLTRDGFAPQWQEIYEQKTLEIIRRLTADVE